MKKGVWIAGSVIGLVLPLYLLKKKDFANRAAFDVSSIRNRAVEGLLTEEATMEEADMVSEGALTTVRYENERQELE